MSSVGNTPSAPKQVVPETSAKQTSARPDPSRRNFFGLLEKAWQNVQKTGYFFFFIVLPASIGWWYYLGRCKTPQPCPERRMMLVALSLACFMIGCLVGFLFSSYGEETGTIGKIRDWVVGGITGVTFVELFRSNGGVFGSLLHRFTVPPGTDNDFALTVSVSVVYLSLGFLFMFFQRELILNIVLAKSRAERGELDGTRQTGLAIQKLLAQLPPSILAGVTDIGETDRISKDEAQELSEALYSDDVSTFLKQADTAAKNGVALDWDTVSKVANVQYYRSYFAPENQKAAQIRKALDWIRRALAMNPLHADLTMKYADMLGSDDQTGAAIAVLQALRVRPEAPAVVEQWLGYYLRSIPSRVDESVEHSNRFLSFFPDDPDTAFNLAYAYGLKYCASLLKPGSPPDEAAAGLRSDSLRFLEKGLSVYPEFGAKVADWPKQDRGLACLGDDPEFKNLLDDAAARAKNKTAS